jgi:flagellar hook assembly protein FlgD
LGVNMTNVTLNSNVFRPSLATTAAGGSSNLASILIETSGTPVTLTWDGTNNSSNLVTPGVYTIEVHWNNGSGQTSDISREIIVMPGSNTSGIAVARPNVLNEANGMTTTFDATGVQNAYSIKVQVYTMTGQLIQTMASPPGSPMVPWNASGMASGIYIAVMEIDNSSGGMLNRQRLKILLLH